MPTAPASASSRASAATSAGVVAEAALGVDRQQEDPAAQRPGEPERLGPGGAAYRRAARPPRRRPGWWCRRRRSRDRPARRPRRGPRRWAAAAGRRGGADRRRRSRPRRRVRDALEGAGGQRQRVVRGRARPDSGAERQRRRPVSVRVEQFGVEDGRIAVGGRDVEQDEVAGRDLEVGDLGIAGAIRRSTGAGGSSRNVSARLSPVPPCAYQRGGGVAGLDEDADPVGRRLLVRGGIRVSSHATASSAARAAPSPGPTARAVTGARGRRRAEVDRATSTAIAAAMRVRLGQAHRLRRASGPRGAGRRLRDSMAAAAVRSASGSRRARSASISARRRAWVSPELNRATVARSQAIVPGGPALGAAAGPVRRRRGRAGCRRTG